MTEGDTLVVDLSASDDDGETVTFSVTGDPAIDGFATATDNGDNTGTLTLAPGDGDAGSYDVTVTVDDGSGEDNATATETFVLTVEEEGATTGTTLRINSGGDAYTAQDGREFSADQHFAGGEIFPSNGNPKNEPIDGTEDDLLYQTERNSGADGAALTYNLPVEDGDYVVTLHFAEIYFGASTNPQGGVGSDGPGGERVFSVNAEGGDAELVDYDINADVGPSTATTQCFTASVADESLDLVFDPSVNRPKVSAIEVVPDDGTGCGDDGGAGGEPVLEPIGDQTVTEDDTLVVDITATDTDTSGDQLTFNATDTPAFATFADDGDGTATLTLNPGDGDAGTYDMTVEVTDGTTTDSETFTITVEAAGGQQLSTVRVNAGGNAHTTSEGEEFSADQYFTGGKTFSTNNAIAGTDEDPLYKTERYGDVTYAIPVTDGTYRVVLHFAEIFATSDGARLFDVAIEGDQVLDDYDIHAKVGHDVATTEEFVTTVDDGEATIVLTTVQDNAKISAIEVLPADGAYLSASPGSVDFGSVQTDQSETQTVTVTHNGSADSGTISGTVTVDGGDFTIDTDSVSLEPGVSQDVTVTFAPNSTGAQSGTLEIVHDGDNSPVTVALSGEGDDGTTPPQVSFGKSALSGEVATNPTSIDTGPDGRGLRLAAGRRDPGVRGHPQRREQLRRHRRRDHRRDPGHPQPQRRRLHLRCADEQAAGDRHPHGRDRREPGDLRVVQRSADRGEQHQPARGQPRHQLRRHLQADVERQLLGPRAPGARPAAKRGEPLGQRHRALPPTGTRCTWRPVGTRTRVRPPTSSATSRNTHCRRRSSRSTSPRSRGCRPRPTTPTGCSTSTTCPPLTRRSPSTAPDPSAASTARTRRSG